LALEGTGLHLEIRPVDVLRPHEDTIPAHVDAIADELRADGIQRDPVLVDRRSGAVLDGMHRVAAFHRLGIPNAVCCTVDYSSSQVSVGRWARVYTPTSEGDVEEAARGFEVMRDTTFSLAVEGLEKGEGGVAVITSKVALMPVRQIGLSGGFSVVRGLDRASAERGWGRGFVPEEQAVQRPPPRGDVTVMVQRLRKEDVVSSARTGALFPCKTSMHTVDPRPVAVNYPIGELEEATTARLLDKVAGQRSRLLPPNSLYRDRRYKEHLLVLSTL
jgi:hypothetical protein